MKKIPVLLAGFLFLTTVLHAQKEPKLFAELSFGPSFPIGKFAEKTYTAMPEDNQHPGMAKTGWNAQVMLGYYINENFGLLFSPGYSVHAQDKSGYEDYLKGNIIQIGGTVNASRVEAEVKNWKIVKLMVGGFLITPLTSEDELVLITKISAGACKTAIPEYSYKAYDENGVNFAGGTSSKTSLPWAFCYQVSMGLKYKLNNKLHVLLDVTSFNATPQKEYTFTFPFSPNPVPPRTEKIKFKLAEVNALIGVGISF